VNGVVFGITAQRNFQTRETHVFFSGTFTFATNNDQSVVATSYIASFNLASSSVVFETVAGGITLGARTGSPASVNTPVAHAVSAIPFPEDATQSYIYVGGHFNGVGTPVTFANSIARYNTISGAWDSMDTESGVGPEQGGFVFALSTVGGLNQGGSTRVYVGGSIHCRISGTVRVEHICGFNEQTNSWFSLGTTNTGN